MRVFGSFTNRVLETAKPVTPELGMGATILMYSDRTAATVILIERNGREIVVQEDNAIRTDSNGMCDSQSYRYEPNENGMTTRFSLRKNGKWVRSGSPMQGGTVLLLGRRDHHYDYGF